MRICGLKTTLHFADFGESRACTGCRFVAAGQFSQFGGPQLFGRI